jgi:hypothetical protein
MTLKFRIFVYGISFKEPFSTASNIEQFLLLIFIDNLEHFRGQNDFDSIKYYLLEPSLPKCRFEKVTIKSFLHNNKL